MYEKRKKNDYEHKNVYNLTTRSQRINDIHPFYEKQGYIQFGQIDDDEGVPHMWMKKKIQY